MFNPSTYLARTLGFWMAWLVVLGGCQINVNGIPIAPNDSDETDQRDGGKTGPRDGHDAGVARSDSGVERADAGDESGDASTPITHAACITAVPSAAPAPLVKRDATGRPTFDWWRDLDCAALPAFETCSEDLATWPCEKCLQAGEEAGTGAAADAGLCVSDTDFSTSPLPDHAIANVRPGSCLLCESHEWKARACCSGAVGVDCRAWPYPADSRPKEPCARHADCEPGLLCKVSPDTDFGVCTCPEDAPSAASCLPPT